MSASPKIQAVSVFTNKGARPLQEDHVLASRERGIFVIADGFGGPVAGARAAKTACEEVRGFLFKEAGDLEATLPFELRSYYSLAGNVLFNSLVHANRKLCGLNQKQNANDRGGASVLAAFLDGDLLAIANAGVCSAWLFRSGKVRELVIPRTLARMQDPMDDAPSPDCQIPLMALGLAEDLEPEVFEYKVRAGDWLLLQSDGVVRGVRERIAELAALRAAGLAGPAAEVPAELPIDAIHASLEASTFEDNASLSLIFFCES